MATAYAPFANGGIGVQPHVIVRVRTANAKLGRVIEPQYVSMMNEMMQETLLTGTARKAELPGWQAAGKTGTSQDFRDAWFVGYTSRLVAGVWLGNDDNSPTKHVTGGNLPVEVWSRFMREAMRGSPPSELPGGFWNASQGVGAPDLVENVLDFLRGGAPASNPDPPIRTRTQAPAAPGEAPPPPSRGHRRAPQAQRGESEEGFIERLFGR